MFADVSQRNGTAEKDVPLILSDMSPDIFLAMLEFIYTNCVTLTPKIVSKISVLTMKTCRILMLVLQAFDYNPLLQDRKVWTFQGNNGFKP